MTDAEKLVRKSLLSMKDDEYKNFHSKLMPTVNPDKIIGIRVPVLRKFSAEIWKNGTGEKFIKNLPHKYYEEDNVHAFCVEKINDIKFRFWKATSGNLCPCFNRARGTNIRP